MENFYKKCRRLWSFPLWPYYLKWVYKKALQDSQNLHISSIHKQEKFTCLLCGVAGEITANEFITFVLKHNPDSKIIIVDIGQEQIDSVKRLVKSKFPNANILTKQANALNLKFIKDYSVDWIDTDGFFSFFDEEQLVALFKEWKRILREDGFITFRELTSHGLISRFLNMMRIEFLKHYLGIKPYAHSVVELAKDFHKLQYNYFRGNSPIPFFDRYCLINRQL